MVGIDHGRYWHFLVGTFAGRLLKFSQLVAGRGRAGTEDAQYQFVVAADGAGDIGFQRLARQ